MSIRSERDYILRLIAAAAAAMNRLRGRLAEGEPPLRIVQEARARQGELLGKDAQLLAALDPASAARLVGDKDRVAAWAGLLRVEADALRAEGKNAEADTVERRADALAAASGSRKESRPTG
jgi:hypothetical protein